MECNSVEGGVVLCFDVGISNALATIAVLIQRRRIIVPVVYANRGKRCFSEIPTLRNANDSI